MSKEYTINEDYLNQIVDLCSRGLVGKVCKRFEISSNPTELKSQTKELIYEEFRKLKDLIDAHQNGWELSEFKFISKQSKEK